MFRIRKASGVRLHSVNGDRGSNRAGHCSTIICPPFCCLLSVGLGYNMYSLLELGPADDTPWNFNKHSRVLRGTLLLIGPRFCPTIIHLLLTRDEVSSPRNRIIGIFYLPTSQFFLFSSPGFIIEIRFLNWEIYIRSRIEYRWGYFWRLKTFEDVWGRLKTFEDLDILARRSRVSNTELKME